MYLLVNITRLSRKFRRLQFFPQKVFCKFSILQKQCFEEMEIKERNLDEVIKDKARFSFPSTRNCEIRKLDTKRCRTPRKKCSPQQRKDRGRRRKRKTVPSVSVVVYLKRSGRSDDASTGSRERGPMVDSFSNLRVSASTGRSLASNENVARHSSGNTFSIMHFMVKNHIVPSVRRHVVMFDEHTFFDYTQPTLSVFLVAESRVLKNAHTYFVFG